MARICSVCGNKADTLTQTANTIGTSVICWSCYDKIKSFSMKHTFETPEDLEKNEEQVFNELYQNAFPDEVIEDYQAYFNNQRSRFGSPISDQFMITTTDSFEGYAIIQYLGIVSGFSSLAFFTPTQEAIAALEDKAAKEALEQAKQKGANAIIGTRIDVKLEGACLITGTAVHVKKDET